MISIGTTQDSNLSICSELPVTHSQCNKLNNEINEKRIKNWLKDNHCTHCLDETKQVKKSELWCERLIINEGDLSKFTELHKSFLEFVDSLPEVEAIDQDLVRKCELVTNLLNELNEGKFCRALLMKNFDIFEVPCGEISTGALIEMCKCFLEKYGNKNGQSAESTAS